MDSTMQWLTRMNFIELAVVVGGVVALVAIVAETWRKHRRSEMDTEVKLELVKQGRSADEIERVLRANSRSKGHDDA